MSACPSVVATLHSMIVVMCYTARNKINTIIVERCWVLIFLADSVDSAPCTRLVFHGEACSVSSSTPQRS